MTVRGDSASGVGVDKVRKTSLDKDLRKIERLEEATRAVSRNRLALGIAVLFLATAGVLASSQIGASQNAVLMVVAAVIGGYMALTIGANDVANNVGPAVGARALTMTGALVIAAIFECAGALIAGGDVVQTISKGIIDPALVGSSDVFVWVMMSALLASALWVHLATFLGAPVSTTHAIVGGVLGAGVAAVGVDVVDWFVVTSIFASWLTSPLIGGVIAAGALAFIKVNLIYQEDKIAAARRWVPVLVALMAAIFAAYLVVKGLSHIWTPGLLAVMAISVLVFALAYLGAKPWVRSQSEGMENRNQGLRKLFHLPLICSAALLSFAHGSNDVANAVGPLAAILTSAESGVLLTEVGVPFWVMLIGAVGISLGLFLFGPRIVRIVGEQITKMNPMRAFCVALSAAFTVLVASQLGLPVSTTHIVVGAVFGVGFFREYYTANSRRRRHYIRTHKRNQPVRKSFAASPDELRRRKLVRRSHFMGIVAAWAITVPSAALLSALIFFAVDWMR
ncbi:inorganic phosphate transporter [Methyloceanibacter marginalis]|jgi:inorganic phosphate transporter, PiT family|uniref:Phosphate transporter n=1 Tax=Methyloceanibacter marginalis TaxID=1774971 RepID=A0A1E3WDL4_9HYPH|nr:inorganic phosphate transporter [Methyloceanibacter marginalis]ODS03913.1 inorganic phosphate transporter [Methyloceanibacter marginalis]